MRRGRLLAAALGAALALAPCMPLRGRLPFIDSGVFLYAGWRIDHGAVLYRDVWDSKPPAIHYLDAAGLALGGGSEWGVWALQWLFLAAALLLSLLVLEPEFGTAPAVLATALWAASLPEFLQMGNMTEQYGLTLKFATLVLVARPMRRRGAFALGALTGALFLLKQNLVALSGAWALWALWCRPELLAPAAAGFAVVLGAVFACFAAAGALRELASAAFVYNAVNESPGWAARRGSLVAGLKVSWEVWLPALAGLAPALRRGMRAPSPLLAVCALALPLELAAASATGRAYRHYYAAWLPVFAVFAAALAAEAGRARAGRRVAAAAAAALAAWPCVLWAGQVRDLVTARPDPVVEYLRRETAPGETVLVWGDGARYNFAARRESPTRFVIAHPLLRRGYDSPALDAEFLGGLRRRPPAALVDLSRADADIPPLESALRPQWPLNGYYAVSPSLEAALTWLETGYSPAATLGRVVVWRPWRG